MYFVQGFYPFPVFVEVNTFWTKQGKSVEKFATLPSLLLK